MLDLLCYLTVVVVGRLLSWIPLRLALALGRVCGSFVYHVPRLRRRVVLANLAHVFGDSRSPDEIRAIAAGTYRHFGMFLVEIMRYAVANPATAKVPVAREDMAGIDELLALKAAGKPAIICTPHHTNFDIGSYAFAMVGLSANVVMKPIESPRVNALVKRTREAWGHRIVLSVPGVREKLEALLRAGEWVAVLPDQRARNRGVVVDFLGKPVSIYRGAAQLHLATGAPIFVCTGERCSKDPRRIRTLVIPVARYEPTGDAEADTQAVMQTVFDRIGEVVAHSPEQYFWFHRLWGKVLATGAAANDAVEAEVPSPGAPESKITVP